MGKYQSFGGNLYPFLTWAVYGADGQSHASAASPSKENARVPVHRRPYGFCEGDKISFPVKTRNTDSSVR
jgi:hypothetical protein